MKNAQRQIIKMALSAIVPLTGIAVGLGLSMGLANMKQQARLLPPRAVATITEVHVLPADDIQDSATPSRPYSVASLSR
jgi:hypothetical protein